MSSAASWPPDIAFEMSMPADLPSFETSSFIHASPPGSRTRVAESHVDDVVAVLLEDDLLDGRVRPSFVPDRPGMRSKAGSSASRSSRRSRRAVHPERLSHAVERHAGHADVRRARVLRLRRCGRDRVELERAARAAAAASRSYGSRRGDCQRGCECCSDPSDRGSHAPALEIPTREEWGRPLWPWRPPPARSGTAPLGEDDGLGRPCGCFLYYSHRALDSESSR